MKALSILLLLALCGCAGSSNIITGKPRAALTENAVTVYSEMPPRSEVIGTVTARSISWTVGAQTQSLTGLLKREAGKIGANGILLNGVNIDTWNGGNATAQAIFVAP